MNKEINTIGDIEIEKRKFQYLKNPILIDDQDISKILISYKFSSGEININTLLVAKMMITKLSNCV